MSTTRIDGLTADEGDVMDALFLDYQWRLEREFIHGAGRRPDGSEVLGRTRDDGTTAKD